MTGRSRETEDLIAQFREAVEATPEPRLFDFREITRRTGASARNLRYVLDHQLLGASAFTRADRPHTSYGVARQFSVYGSFLLSLAALMLEMGLRSGLVKQAINGLFRWAGSDVGGRSGLTLARFRVFVWSPGIVVEIGSGANLRVQVNGDRLPNLDIPGPEPTGWTSIETGEPVASGYAPVVTVRLDLGELRRKLD